MQTLAVAAPKVKAFYATLYDRPGVLGKVDGRIYFFGEDGTITDYEPEMAPWTCVLGQTDIADTQRIMDQIHGDAAWIATHRAQEVA
jgi:hypothetical protein